MVLDTSTKSIIVKLAGAVTTTQLDWSASWVDRSPNGDQYSNAHGQTNSTTEVTMVSAPSESSRREIISITVNNRDTVAATVIIEEADSATRRRLVRRSTAVDSSVVYGNGVFTDFPAPASSIGAVDIVVSGDVTMGDDLSVGDDATISGDLTVTGTSGFTGLLTAANVTMTGTWTYNAFTAKGELIASTADNTPGILAAATADYHVLQSNSSESTGVQWAHRCHLWYIEIADSAAHHTSSSESSALLSATAIPSALINEQRKTIRVRVWGKGSTTSAPNLTLRIKLNDTSVSQAIGTVGGSTPGSGVTDRMVTAEAYFVVRTTGSSGTIQGFQWQLHGTSATHARGNITLNLTNPITVEVTAQWSASSASNTVTLEGMTVEIMN